jgi:hypothetical protein
MTSRLAGPIEDIPSMSWCGRLDFDLHNSGGWVVGTIEISVRIDLVSVWWASRTLAVIDRARLGRWLRGHSAKPFTYDNIELCANADNVGIRIDGGAVHPIPNAVVTQLRSVL